MVVVPIPAVQRSIQYIVRQYCQNLDRGHYRQSSGKLQWWPTAPLPQPAEPQTNRQVPQERRAGRICWNYHGEQREREYLLRLSSRRRLRIPKTRRPSRPHCCSRRLCAIKIRILCFRPCKIVVNRSFVLVPVTDGPQSSVWRPASMCIQKNARRLASSFRTGRGVHG